VVKWTWNLLAETEEGGRGVVVGGVGAVRGAVRHVRGDGEWDTVGVRGGPGKWGNEVASVRLVAIGLHSRCMMHAEWGVKN